jgi:hypothetical protein
MRKSFYAVRRGRHVGVHDSWFVLHPLCSASPPLAHVQSPQSDLSCYIEPIRLVTHSRESCQASVHGFSGQQFRGFSSRADAELWLAAGRPLSPPSHNLQAVSPPHARRDEDDMPGNSSDSVSKRQKTLHAPISESPTSASQSTQASLLVPSPAVSDQVAAPSGSAGGPDMFQLFVHGRVSTRSTPALSSGGALSPTNAPPPASCAAIAWILRRGVDDDATHVCEGTLLVSNITCRYVMHIITPPSS